MSDFNPATIGDFPQGCKACQFAGNCEQQERTELVNAACLRYLTMESKHSIDDLFAGNIIAGQVDREDVGMLIVETELDGNSDMVGYCRVWYTESTIGYLDSHVWELEAKF